VADQERDVAVALAQRRDPDRDRVQAVVQILAEPTGLDLGAQIAVGGRQEADVDRAGREAAEAEDLARVEDPQELDLHRRRQLADLVEEHRPALGALEETGLGGDRAGERARSWPNSSPSRRCSGIAAQLSRRNVLPARGEPSCSALATSSLPVPLSPVISTVDGESATRSITCAASPGCRR
jgi:hypothetical protein